LLGSRESQLPEGEVGSLKSTATELILQINVRDLSLLHHNHSKENMSADVSASFLFNVNGLVAVITGGGTGKSHSQHNFQHTHHLQASA
jgi:hypothetical protein